MDGTDEVEHGSVTKFWWFLLIIPLGLGIGTVTSTCQHLKADLEKDDMEQFRVSEQISVKSLTDDMQKAFDRPNQEARITLKGISSSNGINHYLNYRPLESNSNGETENLGYYDVLGEKKSEILAVVIELDERNPSARAALIGINIAVMKSVFGEKTFKLTLRFVFLPKEKTDILLNNGFLTKNDEKLASLYVIRPMQKPQFTKVEWKEIETASNGIILSHPALDRTDDRDLSKEKISLTFQAARQLRRLLLSKL